VQILPICAHEVNVFSSATLLLGVVCLVGLLVWRLLPAPEVPELPEPTKPPEDVAGNYLKRMEKRRR